MLDRIFNERLQQHAGNHHVEGSGIEFLDHSQLVPPKPYHFNVEIVIDEFEFFAQGRESFTAVEQPPQDRCQLEDHVPRHVGVKAHQRRYRVESIEEEVRIDLVLQRLHARVQQQPLLFLQLDLDAHAVENLQLDADRRHTRCVDGAVDPIVVGTLDAENGAREVLRQFRLQETQANHGPEEHDLPVE